MRTPESPYRHDMPQYLDIEVPDSPAALADLRDEREKRRFEWTLIAVGLLGVLVILAIVAFGFVIAGSGDEARAAAPARTAVVRTG